MARKGRGGGDVSDTGNATSHPGAVSTVDLKKNVYHFSTLQCNIVPILLNYLEASIASLILIINLVPKDAGILVHLEAQN